LRQCLQTLLNSFDDAWSHRLESLTVALEGVTDVEAAHQDASYSSEQGWPGMPPPGTILWQVAHLEHCARHYHYLLVNRPVATQPQTSAPDQADFKGLLAALASSRNKFRWSVAALDDANLDEPCFDDMNVEEFLRMAIRHETWHAAQIVIARRLYQARMSSAATNSTR
jgi:hypothetical protein